jgi:hypothetical protein
MFFSLFDGESREQRRHSRVNLQLPIAFHELTARPPAVHHGSTLDVSRCGVRFRSEAFIAARAFVAFEINLPRRGSCSTSGRVVWSRQARCDGRWEVGAAFLRSGGDADAALAEALLLPA